MTVWHRNLAVFLGILSAIALVGAGRSDGTGRLPAEWADRPIYLCTEAQVGELIPLARRAWPDATERVVQLARMNLGQPYDIYLLGEFPFEDYDPEPIYCLSRSDCVTFCEHMYAMALAEDWATFVQNLQRLRYKDGVIGMLTRNHYTEADWDRHNAFLFEDQTEKLGGGKVWTPLTATIRRAAFFKKHGIGQDIPEEKFEGSFIPKDRVPEILGELRTGDFVNIVRGDAKSQWVGHTGLIAHADDGTVDFLHSAAPAVREQPLLDYLARDRRCVGIKILRLRPDADAIMRAQRAKTAPATDVSPAGLQAALATRYAQASPLARPIRLDATRALRLQGYHLDYDTPVDPELQKMLEEIDRKVGEALGIPEADRAVGVLSLPDQRLALVRPDTMFYGASVPKICILAAYFAENPQAVEALDRQVADELGRMIKLSDNQMAAKYAQLVGVEAIRKLIEKDYDFYDAERGGGLWYGKHYGVAEPRIGDPLHDHSHGATVRQCLRFYLLMEQGKLVSPAASQRMREIFAAPAYEHLEDKFVKGLQGKNLSLIRKSGQWEEWFLDTARVQHGDNVYLIAAMAKHPKGGEYLAAVAGAVDFGLCLSWGEKPFGHETFIHETAEDFRAGTTSNGLMAEEPPFVELRLGGDGAVRTARYESPVIETDHAFNEVLLSWNIQLPQALDPADSNETSFSIEARVGRRRDGHWSPWLYFGDGGANPDRSAALRKCDEGAMKVDYFHSEQRFDRVQYRITARTNTPSCESGPVRVRRISVTLSDTTGRVSAVPPPPAPAILPAEVWQKRLPVPFRTQGVPDRRLAGQICSPTSVAMVLEYNGISPATEEVAARAFDSVFKIYGNWPANVQAAYTFGLEGYLDRFSEWPSVERLIAAGIPLVISIEAEPGELRHAPYRDTDGHLFVLTGFAPDGGVYVNDPAARTPEEGQLRYERVDLEKVWMRARGGTAYVLGKPRE